MGYRDRAVTFERTGNGELPFAATVDGKRWVVRVNDFPADPHVFTLLIDDEEAESFDGWPAAWVMPPEG